MSHTLFEIFLTGISLVIVVSFFQGGKTVGEGTPDETKPSVPEVKPAPVASTSEVEPVASVPIPVLDNVIPFPVVSKKTDEDLAAELAVLLVVGLRDQCDELGIEWKRVAEGNGGRKRNLRKQEMIDLLVEKMQKSEVAS